jgi:hypothetical protein
MKILGIIPNITNRTGKWNGEVIRYGNVGVSGTEQSFVLICEYLASEGHQVYLSFDNCIEYSIYNNVIYMPYSDILNISNDINLLIIPSWYNNFLDYSWNNLEKIVIWCHYQGFINEKILNIFKITYPNVKLYINILSNFVKLYLNKYNDYYKEIADNIFIINNPIMIDLYNSSSFKKEPHSFVFFASFERGGDIFMKVYEKLTYYDKKLYIKSYDSNDNIVNKVINSVSKKEVFEILRKTEYFIYPLALPVERQSIIHKDTDGCVIAESLLHEVIVLTYPVGALKEKYGDHLVYLPYPPGVDINLLEGPDQVSAPQFHSEFVIDSIVKTIEFLENNPQLKEVLKKRGKDYILKERDSDFIKSEWLNNLGLNN